MLFPTREEEVVFLKQLWKGNAQQCPKCRKAELVLLHRKAKKSNNDWKCPECGEIYRTISILYEIL